MINLQVSEEMVFLTTMKSIRYEFVKGEKFEKELTILNTLLEAYFFAKKMWEAGNEEYYEKALSINRKITIFKNECGNICFKRISNLNI